MIFENFNSSKIHLQRYCIISKNIQKNILLSLILTQFSWSNFSFETSQNIQQSTMSLKLSNFVDPLRCWQLSSGVLGIYISYLVTGIVHEGMMKLKYENSYTGTQDKFQYPSAFLIFPCGITWLIGQIVNHYTIKQQERVNIPAKNAIFCAVTVSISTLTYTYAIYLTNFPVVMMFKSCNLISVILVGVLCSRVKDKKLKLGVKKIVVGAIITVGIIIFKVFDPASKKEQKQTQITGIILLIISLLADGFLPDFQAEIKSQFKPKPMEMMTQINKWVTIVSTVYAISLGQFVEILSFIYDHHVFALQMLLMGALSTVGQMFVYRMIKQFKQHFPPFVITTRKIFTVGLSIFWYGHQTNMIQLFGLFLVFALVTYEFVSELVDEKKKDVEVVQGKSNSQRAANDSLQMVEIQPEPKSRYDATQEQLTQEEVKNIEEENYNKRITAEETPIQKQNQA